MKYPENNFVSFGNYSYKQRPGTRMELNNPVYYYWFCLKLQSKRHDA